jgi:hypothetical protein
VEREIAPTPTGASPPPFNFNYASGRLEVQAARGRERVLREQPGRLADRSSSSILAAEEVAADR